MIAAYQSGDPYLAFAKQAGAVPDGATKSTHGNVREQFKACALAVQYGMGVDSLASRIGQSPAQARELLRVHRETYPKFWRWSDAAVDRAMLWGSLRTVFGWTVHAGEDANPRSLRNFPMQANGSEMLRLACCLVTEAGISVCAPVHDAILVEAPLEELDSAVAIAQKAMADASEMVLSGIPLRSDAKLITYPDRFEDARGRQMWDTVREILADLPQPVHGCPQPVHRCNNTRAWVHTRSILYLYLIGCISKMNSPLLEIEKLAWVPSSVSQPPRRPAKPPRHKSGKVLKGPIPWNWLRLRRDCPERLYRLRWPSGS